MPTFPKLKFAYALDPVAENGRLQQHRQARCIPATRLPFLFPRSSKPSEPNGLTLPARVTRQRRHSSGLTPFPTSRSGHEEQGPPSFRGLTIERRI
jgi:hypothetical protein